MSQNDDHIRQEDEDPSRTLDAGQPLLGLGSHIGRYKLLSVLGEGGFGMVYLAEQEQPIKRLVALKVIKPGMDTRQVMARFETERRALALLDHPHIAQVFDAGTTEAGRPYFAMEYVKGIPITEYCDKCKLDTEQRLWLFIPLCQAIQHAHEKGIIHRDIKPSNVLVMLHDDKPIPKIIDFGVAKALHQRLTERTVVTEKGEFIGTPEYMSPEQAELTGLDVDTRTDIYSLGVLLYELLTGCTPFDAQELRSKGYGQMQRIICEQDPVKPSTKLTTLEGKLADIAKHHSATIEQLRKSVRGDLDCIVMKCLEKDRTRRYDTAHGLATDLERHLNSEPVLARPPSKIYRLRKLVRRNKMALAAGAVMAAAVVVLALAGAGWWLARPPHITALAVKPLDDFSGDNSQAYLSDGMTEALTGALSNISALRVPGRSSVMRYKGGRKSIQEMARELNVDAIVEGSVQRAGNRILVTVKLIEAATDRALWSDRFERDLSDFFKVQDEMARAIAGEVQVRLTPEDRARLKRARTVNPDAIEAYLKGMQQWWRWSDEGIANAVGHFRRAVEIEPAYASAQAGLALAYISASTFLGSWPPSMGVPSGEAAAERAIRLDPMLADAYVARGYARLNYHWDWVGAEQDFITARKLSPHSSVAADGYATFLIPRGRFEEAKEVARKALEFAPHSPGFYHDLAVPHWGAGQFDDAIPLFRKVLDLDPNAPDSRLFLGWCYLGTGRSSEALAEFQTLTQLAPDWPWSWAALGHAHALSGRRDEALRALAYLEQLRQKRYVSHCADALVCVGLDQADVALDHLEQAYKERDASWLPWLRIIHSFGPLRDKARFQTLLAKVENGGRDP